MLRTSARRAWKDALRLTKIKLVYTRITLTKWTTLYFFLALLYCLVLVTLQGITVSENAKAVHIINGLLDTGDVARDCLVVRNGNTLEMCKDIPSQSDADCSVVQGTNLFSRVEIALEHQLQSRDLQTEACLQSLIWLNDTIRDSIREDIVTLIFHIWLFLLSFVAILNESLPHLGAALAGHVLVTAWAGYRFRNSQRQQELYNFFIVRGPCQNDFLGNWWKLRLDHTIPVIIINVVVFLLITFLSVKLYNVYAKQSFKRVGASPQTHTVYKLVLGLSVCLQLAGFFTVASTGMWIDKASTGDIRRVAKHLVLYRTVFSIMAVLEIPWVILGWRSVRREQRWQFTVFWIISLLLLISASAIFASPLYMFIFQTWPFFANMTIVSYVLIVVTTALGLICRLHFGKGLPQFLRETEDLEGVDFTPVYISTDIPSSPDEKTSRSEIHSAVELPKSTYQSLTQQNKTSSVYSDVMRDTIKLSSTPPVARFGHLSAALPVGRGPTLAKPTFKVGLPSNPKQHSVARKSPTKAPSGNFF
ncbi:hypothetical protein VKT23_017304 [Stygiomarasmius scandens]|uniref:Uncharacterized protein n=1 Tax=Marasmiellus scandens TaxID=2682957 RepID=A0ABR1ISJ7_9AGAR